MKEGFRQCMAWLHTWTGLVAGWVLFFVFVTGTAGYFNYEIDRWMRPEWPLAQAAAVRDEAAQLALAQAYLQAHHPEAELWNIRLPVERTQPQLMVVARDLRQADGRPGRLHRAVLDPDSGTFARQDAGARATGGGELLYRMHYYLHYVPPNTGVLVVGICTMLMLLAIVSGVITHKKILTDFFTFRPAKGQRSWLDAHNLISVAALPFFLMITYSGLIFFMFDYVPAPIKAGYPEEVRATQRLFAELQPANHAERQGRPAPLASLADIAGQARRQTGEPVASLVVRQPGDAAATVAVRARHEGGAEISRTNDSYFDGVTGRPLAFEPVGSGLATYYLMLDLHEGRFAGPALRWLYFLSGLLGCGMIATGLVLWTAKRKAKQEKRLKAGQSLAFGYRLVHCLNVGTVAGLPAAVAAYFWANRLLPLDMTQRAAWEAHALFLVWGALLLYAACRPARRAWVETLWLGAFLYGFLPVLNALTTHRHLGVTIPAGDWVLAGFDLAMLGLGAVFAYIAWKLGRRNRLAGTASAAARLARAA